MRFYEAAKGMRLQAAVINTPREAKVGCGISVRLAESAEEAVKKIFNQGDYQTFAGFFKVSHDGGKYAYQEIKI
jgi:hypothetical protein